MARVHPIFANWTSGELSPLLYGRVDFEKYLSGARRLENMAPHPHGPASRRPGTRFVAEVKDSTRLTYVLPFEFNTEQAYVIEFGHQYMRFYKDGGQIIDSGSPVEAAHVFTETQLKKVKYIQSADTMYFFHPDVAPQKLVRASHISWTMKAVKFLPPATFEDGHKPAQTLTLGAVTGLGVTFTAGGGANFASDVGRMITIGDGRAIITAVPTATTYTVDIVDDFSAVGPWAAGDWTIGGSPNTTCTPSVASKPKHAKVTLTLTAAGWRTTDDVGKYVRINKGVVRIYAVTSATVASAEIMSELVDLTASTSGAWSLESAAWSATRGYPRCACFHEQRMVVAGSNFQPQTLWGSASADIENFGLGPDDDDAFEFKIAANDVNSIFWLVPTRVLLFGTAAAEFRAVGGSDNPITPTNIDVKTETAWGSNSDVRPLRIAHAGIFVDRSRRDVREILFSFERDSYVSNNLLLLAEHLTRDHGIIELGYQRTPHSTIWAIREDGVLLSCTYQREHNVIAWARHFTGPDQPQDGTSPVQGKFESVTVIPHWSGNRDVPWFVVQRQIQGSAKRYIEHFDEEQGYYGKVYLDSAISYNGPLISRLTGLTHLAGQTVQILGDGAVYPDAVVTQFSPGVWGVDLNGPTAARVEIGLQYISTLETMDPEVPLQGTTQGRQRHWSEIYVRLDTSLGCWVDDEELPFRSSTDTMDEPPPIFTGDHKLQPALSREPRVSIKVQQKQPLPLTVVAVFGTLGIGE